MLKMYLHDHAKSPFLIVGIFVLFLCIRIFAWENTVLFEDLDSLGYLETVKTFLQADLEGIINLSADYTPGYAIVSAFFSLPGWGVETGARLTSLFFSSLIFLALLGIGRQIASRGEVAIGLLIISLSPFLISHSFSVLSEPTYVGLLYLGLWLFWGQYKNPVVGKAALLGITFGFAFLTRMEGILYLLIIPFLQGVYTYWVARNLRSLKPLVTWSIIYILCFSAIAAPQIWRVSQKMGTLAISGRQVWTAVANAPDGKSYAEKFWGLDYSPSEINITYLKTHPEDVPHMAGKNLFDLGKKFFRNFDTMHRRTVSIVLGPLCLIAFSFGLLSLYRSGYRFEIFLILAFLAFNVVAPLMTTHWIRHLLPIAPMICLVAGIGIVYASREFSGNYHQYSTAQGLVLVLLLCAMLATWAVPLREALKSPDNNKEYSPAELREPFRILKNIAENELGRAPRILDSGYLTYLLGGTRLAMPYTNYQGLVKYCKLNEVEFLYFRHQRLLKLKFPFYEELIKGRGLVDFVSMYTGLDADGEKIELFRFVPQAS